LTFLFRPGKTTGFVCCETGKVWWEVFDSLAKKRCQLSDEVVSQKTCLCNRPGSPSRHYGWPGFPGSSGFAQAPLCCVVGARAVARNISKCVFCAGTTRVDFVRSCPMLDCSRSPIAVQLFAPLVALRKLQGRSSNRGAGSFKC